MTDAFDKRIHVIRLPTKMHITYLNKVRSYIAQYPVLRIAQSVFTLYLMLQFPLTQIAVVDIVNEGKETFPNDAVLSLL